MASQNQSDNMRKAVTSGITATLIIAIVIITIVFISRSVIPTLERHPEITYWLRLFGVIFLSIGTIAFAVLLAIGIGITFKLIESSGIKVNFLLNLLWSIPGGVVLLILSKYLP